MSNYYEVLEYFLFLDKLRNSGETNMFVAAVYLQCEYTLTKHESSEILTAWMRTFSSSKSLQDRAKEYFNE